MAFTKILGAGIATDTDIQLDDIFAGIVTATSFRGDASQLTGLPGGLGTALSTVQGNPLSQLYYNDEILSIGSTITVDPPASSSGAYTQYTDIVIEQDADLIIADGDDFIPDILGLSTEGSGAVLTGAGGRIRADNLTDKTGVGAPNFPNGITVGAANTIRVDNLTNVAGTGAPNFPNGITVGGGALNDEKQHSGSAFQNVVYEVPDVIDITDDTTLTSLYSQDSTMFTKRKEVRVAQGKTLTIAPGDAFVINAYGL